MIGIVLMDFPVAVMTRYHIDCHAVILFIAADIIVLRQMAGSNKRSGWFKERQPDIIHDILGKRHGIKRGNASVNDHFLIIFRFK